MPARCATYADVQRGLRGHLPVLDGVRGLAILFVFVHNIGGPDGPSSGLLELFDVVTNVGWIGVQLFFVLSGFLITGILLDTKGARGAWGAFTMRRVLRIFPLYYAVLALAFVFTPLVLGRPVMASSHAVFFLLYLQNWSPALIAEGGAGNLAHFWSLAVEEQFYLAWPIVVFALRRRGFVAVALALTGLALLSRIVLLVNGADVEWVYAGTFARMDALAVGGLAALVVRDEASFARWSPRLRPLTWALGLVLVGLVVASHGLARTNVIAQTGGYSVLALFFAGLVLCSLLSAQANGPLARALSMRPLRVLGTYSYGIYVFHIPMVVAARRALHIDLSTGDALHRIALRAGFTVVALLGVLLAAVASYQLFEKRFLVLKRYFVARPDPASGEPRLPA